MSKPSAVPSWASDTNFSGGGSETGLSTKLEPSTGVKAQGFVAGEEAPARWFNWLLNLICLWLGYVDNLPNEAAFVGADFAWTGDHTFQGGATITVDRELLYNVPFTFYAHVPLAGTSGDATVGWRLTDLGLTTAASNVIVPVQIPLPMGATCSQVSATVYQSVNVTGGGSHQTRLSVYLCTKVSNGATLRTLQGSSLDWTGADGDYTTVTPTFTPFVVSAHDWVELVVGSPAGLAGGNLATLDAVEVKYTKTQTGGV